MQIMRLIHVHLHVNNLITSKFQVIICEHDNVYNQHSYEVLPKSSGNLNSTREPVVVWPAAAKWGEQYPL
jgi:hypothetical protein